MVGQRPTVKVKQISALTARDIAAWQAMRAGNAALYSPYFHIGYTQAVAALRDDVRVLCAYDAQSLPLAFLPLQGRGFARPVGAPLTDYHGFICRADTTFDPIALLKEAGIGAYHFSAAVNSGLENFHQTSDQGVLMHMPEGAQAWRETRDSSYRRHLKSNRRRARKSAEDIGQARCEWKSQDEAVFEKLIEWKAKKFEMTGKYDVLGAGWTLELLRKLWREPLASLRCDMHALYFGERLAAVDLGLSDGKTFHSWIVAYDGELHSYAPGIQLLELMIDAAEDMGYDKIDLGAGLDGYKRHYASEDVKVGTGFIAAQGPAGALSQLYSKAELFGQKALKDAPGKLRRRYSQIAACEDSFSGRAKAMVSAMRSQGS